MPPGKNIVCSESLCKLRFKEACCIGHMEESSSWWNSMYEDLEVGNPARGRTSESVVLCSVVREIESIRKS